MNARTREGFYTVWTLAILICLAVCVFLLTYVSIVGGGETVQSVPEDAEQAAPVPAAEGGETAVTEDAAQAAAPAADAGADAGADAFTDLQSRLVFLGDSTTYGLYTYGLLPHWQVWTPASGTLSLFNWAVETIQYYPPGDDQNAQTLSIADTAAARQPEYLIVTLGINGVAILDESGFKDYYTGLISAIQQASPNTKIFCNSIYPVIDANTVDEIKNDKINAANSWIQAVAAQTGTTYLNSHDALTDESGNLSAQYVDAQNDGIHMNANGYTALLQYFNANIS